MRGRMGTTVRMPLKKPLPISFAFIPATPDADMPPTVKNKAMPPIDKTPLVPKTKSKIMHTKASTRKSTLLFAWLR